MKSRSWAKPEGLKCLWIPWMGYTWPCHPVSQKEIMPTHMQHNTNVKDPIIWKSCLFAFYRLQGTSWWKWHESNAVHTTGGMAPTGWRGPWGREGWGVSVQKQVLSFQLPASPSHLSTFSHVSSSLLAQFYQSQKGISVRTPTQPGHQLPLSLHERFAVGVPTTQPPHRQHSSSKEQSQGQEDWPVMSREFWLWP